MVQMHMGGDHPVHRGRRQPQGRKRAQQARHGVVGAGVDEGGVAGLDDIDRLCEIEHEGIEGAILGRALYEGHLDFRAAQARADELNGES
jgi:phosphoribosylformimino-5-aminoimidazole carboxamide ribonucleotide (ProFAR) isomerase